METEHLPASYSPIRWAVLVALCLSGVCFQLVAMAYAPLLGEVAKGLNVELPQAVQLMTIFMLFSSFSFFIGGVFADRYGPALSVTVSAALAFVPTFLTLWVGESYAAVAVIRALQGFTVGFCMAGMVPLAIRWFPMEQRALALGITGACIPLGAMTGVVLTPMLFNAFGDWKAAMAGISVIPLLTLLYCVFIFRLTRGREPAMIGAPEGQGSAGAGARAALASPFTWLGVVVTFAANWLMQTAFGITPSYFAEAAPVGLGLGPMAGGSLMSIMQVASIIAPVIGGYITGKYLGGRPGGMLVAALLLSVTYGALQFSGIYGVQPLFFLFLILPGLGIGMLMPLLQTKIAEAYDPRIVGTMNGIWMGVGSFGGSVGLFVSAQALAATGTYVSTVNILAVVAVAGALLAIVLNRLQRGSSAAPGNVGDKAAA